MAQIKSLPKSVQDVMKKALSWLEDEQLHEEDCGDPGCEECEFVVRPRQKLIDNLRAQLKRYE